MSYCYLPTIQVVPGHSVFNDLGSQLMLEVERNLESLAEAIFIDLLYLGAGCNIHTVDLILDDEVGEVHVNLGDYLFSSEVINSEPKVLSKEVFLDVPDTLTEDQRPLSTVIVLESNSFVDNLPSLIRSNDVVLVIRRDCALDLELE